MRQTQEHEIWELKHISKQIVVGWCICIRWTWKPSQNVDKLLSSEIDDRKNSRSFNWLWIWWWWWCCSLLSFFSFGNTKRDTDFNYEQYGWSLWHIDFNFISLLSWKTALKFDIGSPKIRAWIRRVKSYSVALCVVRMPICKVERECLINTFA